MNILPHESIHIKKCNYIEKNLIDLYVTNISSSNLWGACAFKLKIHAVQQLAMHKLQPVLGIKPFEGFQYKPIHPCLFTIALNFIMSMHCSTYVHGKVYWYCLDALCRLDPCSFTASCTLIAKCTKPASQLASQLFSCLALINAILKKMTFGEHGA